MRHAVAVLCVLLLANCSGSNAYWRHTESSDIGDDLHDGSEVLLITSERAIHLLDAHVKDGFVSGRAEHIWKIPAGTKIYSTDYESKPVDLAVRFQWLELADDPGPVAVSTIRFARILPGDGGGGQPGVGSGLLKIVLVVGGLVLLGFLLSSVRLH